VLRRDRSDATGIPAEYLRTDYPLLKTDPCGRCIALRGEVGRGVACAIYEHRPNACRSFQPGSTLCLEARQSQNLPT
jgi:Fe-S-cluster containining protein